MLFRLLRPSRAILLAAPLLGSCTLLGAPPELPPPIAVPTIAPGDVLRVRPDGGSDEPAVLLTVAPDGTIDVPGVGPMVVEGYTVEDFAAILTSLHPELGAVRVEALPAIAQGRAIEASARREPDELPR